MRVKNLTLAELEERVITIGFVDENLYTQVRIDCKELFDEHPDAIPSLAVQPPQGNAYPAVVTREGDIVVWNVAKSDVQYANLGRLQLTFTIGEIVAKSYVGKYVIDKSIMPDGEAPTPIENWITEANAILGEIPGTIAEAVDDALEEAKESGEFDGADGVSPVVNVTKTQSGHNIVITDAEGDHSFDVPDGTEGKDGVTPQFGIGTVSEGHTADVTMTGTKENPVLNFVMPKVATEDIVAVQDTQPTAEETAIWFPETPPTPVQVPTYAEHLELKEDVDSKVADVKYNGTSFVDQNGVAIIPPAQTTVPGLMWTGSGYGLKAADPNGNSAGRIQIDQAIPSQIKGFSEQYRPITPKYLPDAVFHGMAKAAGDNTQSSSQNPVGTYTDDAKEAIQEMLNVPDATENETAHAALMTDINSIYNAIDYSKYLVKNDDFENGLWANGTWRTDGNYGKYKSNKNGFELEDFIVKVSTASYTDLVISITCFDENDSSAGNFITNNAVIQSGSYAVTKASILNGKPTAKYISIAIGKLSGSTYYDLPSDIVITVERTNEPQTIADRVSALESLIRSGTSVVVAQNGGGDYNTIEDAVNGITDDSASKPYTILIKNGVYDEHIHVGGDRYLSFVGESRENCIIRSHTGMYTDAPLWIDGNFSIENLTLQMLDDEAPDSWTPGTSQSDPETMLPGYALHVDGGSSALINSVYGYKLGVVRNCTLYSVAFPAIGAGLHANQKIIFEDCDFIRNTSAKYHTNQYQYYTNYSGAMIIHDSTHSGDTNQNLEIINCRFICNLGKSATFRFKYGSPENVKYAMIDNTFWCAETSSPIVDSDIQGSVLLGYSHGNNNTDFNA